MQSGGSSYHVSATVVAGVLHRRDVQDTGYIRVYVQHTDVKVRV